MDRGAWETTVHGFEQELNTTQQLNRKMSLVLLETYQELVITVENHSPVTAVHIKSTVGHSSISSMSSYYVHSSVQFSCSVVSDSL